MMVYSEITAKSFYTSDKRNMKNLDRIKIRAIYDWNVGIAISRIAARGGGRRNLWRLGGRSTRLWRLSLAGGNVDCDPCRQNRQLDIIIFGFSNQICKIRSGSVVIATDKSSQNYKLAGKHRYLFLLGILDFPKITPGAHYPGPNRKIVRAYLTLVW